MSDPAPIEGTPVMMTDAYVQIGDANLKCLCESVSLTADLNPISVTTFCGVSEYPGPVKWHMVAKFLQSFDPGATDDTLTQALDAYRADGTPVQYKVRPYASQPPSARNPQFEGELIPQDYTVFGGDAGAASEVDIDWTMTGPPSRNTGTNGGGGNQPTITSVAPSTGAEAGGTAVVITGTGFTGATGVNFNAAAGTAFSVANDTTINVSAPAGTGTADVTVLSPNGDKTSLGAFTYE